MISKWKMIFCKNKLKNKFLGSVARQTDYSHFFQETYSDKIVLFKIKMQRKT